MHPPVAIYSKRCWIDGDFSPFTLILENGKISDLIQGRKEIMYLPFSDFGNDVIMPGVIDAHVHINEPGRTAWEGLKTATLAAAAGGITTLVDMPLNAHPVTTTVAALNQKKAAFSAEKRTVNIGFYGGLVPGNANELEGLIHAGVLGIKAFLVHSGIDDFPNVRKRDLETAMEMMAPYHVPLLVHCELEPQGQQPTSFSKPYSYRQYLQSRPKAWENEAIRLMIELCEKYKCPIHIVHVSSAEALELIARARKKGLPVTAETCPHYLYFYAEGIPDKNALFKCAPPIREQENNQQLKSAFRSGILDFIASDHSPAPPEIKEIDSGNLSKAWGGISGLQYLLSGAWSALKKELTLEEFIPLLTEHPARFLGISDRKGFLKTGQDADLTIWSPEMDFIVRKEANQHRHKISPYTGERLYGKVTATYVNGIAVFNKKLNNKTPGTWVFKKQH